MDTIRGLAIISMVAFHIVYDLAYLYGKPMIWFTQGPIQELWRISISWTFLALAGWMTSYSRNNFRRAGAYGIVATAVWAATSLAPVDTPISFGIIFCMAASTFIWAILERIAGQWLDCRPYVLAGTLLIAFISLYEIPRQRYGIPGLAWLGFPDSGFFSGDYYPIIPFSLLYLASATIARAWRCKVLIYPAWMHRDWCPPLTALGTLGLPIYVLHQPIALCVLELIFR